MKIERVSFAVTDMDAMLRFYNSVFDARLEPAQSPGCYHGALAGIPVTFIPNSIVEVKAEQNRQQFSFAVNDLDRLLDQVRASGGVVQDDATETKTRRSIGVRDPDGNTIELIQHR